MPVALLSLACGTTPPPGVSPAGNGAEQLVRNTPRATVTGNTFIAPAGWRVEVRGPTTIARAAGRRFAHRAGRRAGGDADGAVAAAWAAYRPDAKWPLKVANNFPDKDGWTNIRDYTYQTSPNEKRDVGANAQRADETVDRHRLRHGAGGRREARRAGRADLRTAVAEGLLSARRSPEGRPHRWTQARDRRARGVHRDGHEGAGVPGVAVGLVQDGKVVFADGFGVRELRQAGEARRRHALHDRVEHEGDDDADARPSWSTRGSSTWDTPVTALLPSFKLGDADDHAAGAGEAPDLRVHRPAAAGLRVAVPVQGRDTRSRAGNARHDAADQQVRRDVPVLEPAGRRRRLHRRPRGVSRRWSSAPPTTRRCARACSSRSA